MRALSDCWARVGREGAGVDGGIPSVGWVSLPPPWFHCCLGIVWFKGIIKFVMDHTRFCKNDCIPSYDGKYDGRRDSFRFCWIGFTSLNLIPAVWKVEGSPGATASSSNGRWGLLVKEVGVEIHLQSSHVPPSCVPLHLHPSRHPQHHHQEAPHAQLALVELFDVGNLMEVLPSQPSPTKPVGSWVVNNSSSRSCHWAIVHSWILSVFWKLYFLHLLFPHRISGQWLVAIRDKSAKKLRKVWNSNALT